MEKECGEKIVDFEGLRFRETAQCQNSQFILLYTSQAAFIPPSLRYKMCSNWWELSWCNDNHLKLRIHKLNKPMMVCKAKKQNVVVKKLRTLTQRCSRLQLGNKDFLVNFELWTHEASVWSNSDNWPNIYLKFYNKFLQAFLNKWIQENWTNNLLKIENSTKTFF